MWYVDHRPLFPPDFRDSVDAVLQELEDAGDAYLTPSDVSSMFMGRLELPDGGGGE